MLLDNTNPKIYSSKVPTSTNDTFSANMAIKKDTVVSKMTPSPTYKLVSNSLKLVLPL